MAAGSLAMSGRERERLVVIAQVCGKVLSQGLAAKRLGICVRQVKRLVRTYRAAGDAGLVSRRRGRASNRRLAPGVGERASELLGGKYRDFGATLACEKLAELEGIFVSRETIRRLQIRLGLWKPKRRRHKRVFQLRERRPRFGELIQIDGSPHDWFEGRGPRCTLIVFIDDATGRLTALRFTPCGDDARLSWRAQKTMFSRMAVRRLSIRIGTAFSGSTPRTPPAATARPSSAASASACEIELINALTPQAKGRVERANQTLQDRLVREMRLTGVSSIEEAQVFTPAFIAPRGTKSSPCRRETAKTPIVPGPRAPMRSRRRWRGARSASCPKP
jgi:transposase